LDLAVTVHCQKDLRFSSSNGMFCKCRLFNFHTNYLFTILLVEPLRYKSIDRAEASYINVGINTILGVHYGIAMQTSFDDHHVVLSGKINEIGYVKPMYAIVIRGTRSHCRRSTPTTDARISSLAGSFLSRSHASRSLANRLPRLPDLPRNQRTTYLQRLLILGPAPIL
jgi:hypothetical protein